MKKFLMAICLASMLYGVGSKAWALSMTIYVKYLPYLQVDNNWDSYIAIQNYGTAEAKHVDGTTNPKSLYLTAYDKSGVQIGINYTGAIIPANGMVLLDARTIFGATPSDGAIMVRITMNNDYTLKIMGIMTNKNTVARGHFMLEDAVSAYGQTLVVPESIDSDNYNTTIAVCNPGTTPETVNITGKDSVAVSYTTTTTIASNGFSAKDITSWFSTPSFSGKEGWFKATATNNSLIGAVIYTNSTNNRNTKSLVSLSTITRVGSLTAYIPMAVYSPDIVTPRLMIANNFGSAQDVTIKAIKPDGTDFGIAKTSNMLAHGYYSVAIDKNYFSSATDLPTYFTLKITSASTELYPTVAYVFSDSYTQSAGDIVITTPLENPWDNSLNIPFYLTISPYQNYLFVQNTGTASSATTITAYKPDGSIAGNTTKSIPANGMEMFVVNEFAPNGYGSIKISGSSEIFCTSVHAYSDGTKQVWGGYSLGN